MKVAKKANVLLYVGSIRLISRCTFRESEGHAEPDALTRPWSQSSLSRIPRIRFRKPLLQFVSFLR